MAFHYIFCAYPLSRAVRKAQAEGARFTLRSLNKPSIIWFIYPNSEACARISQMCVCVCVCAREREREREREKTMMVRVRRMYTYECMSVI